MSVQEWLDLFRRNRESKILRVQDLKILTGMKPPALRVALERLAKRGIVQRVCRGYYANPFNPPSLEEISAFLYRPSCVSLESALAWHGVLSQIPHTLTCVTPRLTWRLNTSFGRIEYRQIKKSYLFGLIPQEGYLLAEPEKALVDFLYLNRKADLHGFLSELHLDLLRPKKLSSYARRMRVDITALRETVAIRR